MLCDQSGSTRLPVKHCSRGKAPFQIHHKWMPTPLTGPHSTRDIVVQFMNPIQFMFQPVEPFQNSNQLLRSWKGAKWHHHLFGENQDTQQFFSYWRGCDRGNMTFTQIINTRHVESLQLTNRKSQTLLYQWFPSCRSHALTGLSRGSVEQYRKHFEKKMPKNIYA